MIATRVVAVTLVTVTAATAESVLPSLTDEERQRVADHIKGAEPSYETVVQAVQAKK